MLERTPRHEIVQRPRRLRSHALLRGMVRDAEISKRRLVQPLFVEEHGPPSTPIPSMPGIYRYNLQRMPEEASRLQRDGVPAVLLFGIPARKDPDGRAAYDTQGVIQRAVTLVRDAAPDLMVWTDVCLCEYTDHGHCGIVTNGGVDNDATLALLARTAVSHAAAGAHFVAPSAMMDGQVAAIRRALDANGHSDVGIVSYAAKYASAFYGPFRDAAESTPRFGDRRTYQMDPGNLREAMREIEEDVHQGADAVLVKPALAYLDVLHAARERFDVPIGAYHVSGEYAMLKAAAGQGWLDENLVLLEMLQCMRRAGADFVITYYAHHAQRLIKEDGNP